MVNAILTVALVIGGLGALLALWRLYRGPEAASRALSVDVLTMLILPLIVGYAVFSERAIYLDVAFVYALLSFVGVMSLARYFDKGV
ncbi:cation:proton antiporter [Myxococcota bacterium]|nr:cation:proton antiporter [Myxococcota bacterium]MBU1431805.1 cation:proton antiporter [Myxococcota bacterium]MBU1896657.1 cation:proton antiporter [Myxococcota bacterium]